MQSRTPLCRVATRASLPVPIFMFYYRSDDAPTAASASSSGSGASGMSTLGAAVPAGTLGSGDWAEIPVAPTAGSSSLLIVSGLRARVTEISEEEMDNVMGEGKSGEEAYLDRQRSFLRPFFHVHAPRSGGNIWHALLGMYAGETYPSVFVCYPDPPSHRSPAQRVCAPPPSLPAQTPIALVSMRKKRARPSATQFRRAL